MPSRFHANRCLLVRHRWDCKLICNGRWMCFNLSSPVEWVGFKLHGRSLFLHLPLTTVIIGVVVALNCPRRQCTVTHTLTRAPGAVRFSIIRTGQDQRGSSRKAKATLSGIFYNDFFCCFPSRLFGGHYGGCINWPGWSRRVKTD